MVNKILCSLARTWEPKVTLILGAKDLIKLELDHLIGSLIAQEIINSNVDDKKKKGMALKALLLIIMTSMMKALCSSLESSKFPFKMREGAARVIKQENKDFINATNIKSQEMSWQTAFS